MKTAVDTNILYDILLDDPDFGEASQRALAEALRLGSVVICPVVYAELAVHFDDPSELSAFLKDFTIKLDSFEPRSLHEAGRVWGTHAHARGQRVQCRQCGYEFKPHCPSCQSPVVWRQHLIPDFLVGAHAVTQTGALLTRDRGYYSKYFPGLKLIVPEHPQS